MTYWCVTTEFFDDGDVRAFVEPVITDVMPEQEFLEKTMCDQYKDYFETLCEARKFAAQAMRA